MAKDATNPWVVLVLICLAQFMVILDATIVNVALPSIQKRPASVGGEPAVDRERLHARVRRLPAARRPRRRPARAQAPVPDRPRDLHRSVAARRPRRQRGHADRRPRAAGPRRRADLAGRAVDHRHDVRRGRRAREGARRLGRDRDRRLRRRPGPRRRADAVLLLAVDLLRQRPGRHRRVRPLAAADPRVAGRARAPELRHRRRGHGHRRPDGARLRDRRRRSRRAGARRRRSASSRSPPCCSRRSS